MSQFNWPFDVFLCHNSHDKNQVSEIAQQLKTSGLNVWLDEWELQPGKLWKQELDEHLLEVGSVAVFVGPGGTPWSDLDIQAFLLEFARLNCPIIPVILEEVRTRPELPTYMQGQSWVDFRKYRPDPIQQLRERISHKPDFAIARPTLAYPDDEPSPSFDPEGYHLAQAASSEEYVAAPDADVEYIDARELNVDNLSDANGEVVQDEVDYYEAEYYEANDDEANDVEANDIQDGYSEIEDDLSNYSDSDYSDSDIKAEQRIDHPQPTITELHQGIVVHLGDSTHIEMRNIPAGSFVMGAPTDEQGSDNDERPQHEVKVSPFAIASYPVTQSQWRMVARWPRVNHDLSLSPSGFNGDNRPVESVTFEQAQEFCDRLTQYSGWSFRLPSEAEWEYACRSGTKTPYHFGDDISPETANTLDTHNQTTDVGNYPANGYGLYDMHGNVWEWCTDYWHNSYDGAPDTSKPWVEGEFDDTRVLRGGSWDSEPSICRSSYRIGCKYDGCDYFIGFRVVCDPEDS
ncbi:MAG: SUMF1/EgtB/PvdO family nonheme iron enzyme [Synechococcus sp.]